MASGYRQWSAADLPRKTVKPTLTEASTQLFEHPGGVGPGPRHVGRLAGVPVISGGQPIREVADRQLALQQPVHLQDGGFRIPLRPRRVGPPGCGMVGASGLDQHRHQLGRLVRLGHATSRVPKAMVVRRIRASDSRPSGSPVAGPIWPLQFATTGFRSLTRRAGAHGQPFEPKSAWAEGGLAGREENK